MATLPRARGRSPQWRGSLWARGCCRGAEVNLGMSTEDSSLLSGISAQAAAGRNLQRGRVIAFLLKCQAHSS